MKEIRDIVQAFDKAVKDGKKTALATVVHVSGSSYRRPGARMLVTDDGQLTGAISGGCLEGDALRKAVLAITQGKKKLIVYNTMDEDDAKLGIQLGCNGIVSILFEPIDAPDTNPVDILKEVIKYRNPAVIITGYSMNNQEHLGTFNPTDVSGVLKQTVTGETEKAFNNAVSGHCELSIGENQQKLFFEYCVPSVSLVVAGAGNDALPLVSMAGLIGWTVTLVDGRSTHANRQRFPLAEKIMVGKPKEVMDHLVLDSRTALVLMTHNYNYDLEMLGLLQNKSLHYIGLLGPAAKRERMLLELAEKGIYFSESALKGIYGPTGLDLGSETSAEIALSICSEIMAVLQGKDPIHLKQKPEPIHQLL